MECLVEIMFKHDNYKIHKLYVIANMKGMAVKVANGVSDSVQWICYDDFLVIFVKPE